MSTLHRRPNPPITAFGNPEANARLNRMHRGIELLQQISGLTREQPAAKAQLPDLADFDRAFLQAVTELVPEGQRIHKTAINPHLQTIIGLAAAVPSKHPSEGKI
jgi:hypothetical protein